MPKLVNSSERYLMRLNLIKWFYLKGAVDRDWKKNKIDGIEIAGKTGTQIIIQMLGLLDLPQI